MTAVSKTIQIQQPPARVFALLADPQVQRRFDGEILRSVEQLTPGPIGTGTRFRGDFKGLGKLEYVYATYEPDQLIEHDVRLPTGRLRHRFEFNEVRDSATQLVQTMTLTPNLLGKLLWPLVLRHKLEQRAQALNALVEDYAEHQPG